MRSGRHHGAWGGLEEVSDQIRCQVSRGRSDKKDGVGVGQAVRRAGWAGGAMASLRVSSSNNLQVKSAARHTSIPGARASGGARKVWRHTDRPRLEHRPDEIGKKDGMDAPPKTCPCGVCALAIISPGPRDNSSRSSPTRRPRMKPKAQQTLAPATPPPPLPSLPTTPCRTKKEKTIKTHQSPPSSAEHAVVPPRPSAAAAHGVAHVDGNAAASFFAFLPKTSPAAQFVASFASHRDPSRAVVAVRLPLSMQSSFKVSAVVGRVGSGLSAGASIRVVVLWDWLAALVVES